MGRVSRPAAFVDRDGTINVRAAEHEYLTSVGDFEWLPGAVDGLVLLARAGYPLTVVSNQRGVARGLVSTDVLSGIEDVIQRGLREYGCSVEAFKYCVHDLDAGCDCRKPKPGMLLELADKLELDLARSWMIGDTESDVLAGRAAGCRTALIGDDLGFGADIEAADLLEAAERIAAQPRSAANASVSSR